MEMNQTNSEFQKDMDYAHRHMVAMQRLLGEWFILEAPFAEDVKHNTDLIMLTSSGTRFACRVRQPYKFTKPMHDFTIRCNRQSGVDTEIDKLMSGWGDIMLYAVGTRGKDELSALPDEQGQLDEWVIIDLTETRRWIYRHMMAHSGAWPGIVRVNHEPGGSSLLTLTLDVCEACAKKRGQEQGPMAPPAIVRARSAQSGSCCRDLSLFDSGDFSYAGAEKEV